jgi:hypothetical protein
VRALAVETHEEWLESPRYLNMDDLRVFRDSSDGRSATRTDGRLD